MKSLFSITLIFSFLLITNAAPSPAETTVAKEVTQSRSRLTIDSQNNSYLNERKIERAKQKLEKKHEKSKKSKKKSSGGKSQLVALLLCIFVGALGIHRFYLGYVGIGVIQLLTAGCCGIWTLIDLIMIITGNLKPKDGEYEETF